MLLEKRDYEKARGPRQLDRLNVQVFKSRNGPRTSGGFEAPKTSRERCQSLILYVCKRPFIPDLLNLPWRCLGPIECDWMLVMPGVGLIDWDVLKSCHL